MLPPVFKPQKKRHRLKSNRDFQSIYSKGRFFASPLLVLYYLPGAKDTATRIGYAVARKSGKAVKRNRLRRRLREIVRLNTGVLPAEGASFIVMTRQSAALSSYDDLNNAYLRVTAAFGRWKRA